MKTIKVKMYACDYCNFLDRDPAVMKTHEQKHLNLCKHEKSLHILGANSSGIYLNIKCETCRQTRTVVLSKLNQHKLKDVYNAAGGIAIKINEDSDLQEVQDRNDAPGTQ